MPTIEIPYAPRKQLLPFHNRKERFACIVAHRRFGKTVGAINDLIKSALSINRENVRCGYIAPYFNQAKAISWDYIKQFTAPIPGMSYNESELRADFPNGARLRLFGADNYDAMRGLYFDDVVLDEPADFPANAWPTVIRPALADRQGRATFIGTPKGKNEFWEIYDKATRDPNWFTLVLPASQTGIIPQIELNDALKTIGPDRYDQEFECSFEAAIIGAYYGKEMKDLAAAGRIRNIIHEPQIGVVTAWDLGMDDTTSIIFAQYVGNEVRIIDHIEDSGAGLAHYARLLADKPYQYLAHVLPHDARVRELGSGVSRVETLEGLGLRNIMIAPNIPIEDGIQAVRNGLARTFIDAKQNRLIEALKQYQRDWDERSKTWRSRPKHDWCFTGDTKVLTRSGMYQIKDLPYNGEVLTLCGWKQYQNPRVTRANARLVAVTFNDGNTVRCTPDHMFMTENGWISAENLETGSVIQSTLTPRQLISTAASTAYGRLIDTCRAAAENFTAMCGPMLSGKSHMVATSITKTGTRETICLQTWNAWMPQNIFGLLGQTRQRQPQQSTLANLHDDAPQTGTHQKKEGFGTRGMLSAQRVGLSGKGKPNLARTAKKSLTRLCEKMVTLKNIAVQTARPLRVARVENLRDCEDVWCMTVPDNAHFSLHNGAVVHNCSHSADSVRYLFVGYRQVDDDWGEPLRRNLRGVL